VALGLPAGEAASSYPVCGGDARISASLFPWLRKPRSSAALGSAVDASGSVDQCVFDLQKRGYVALSLPAVLQAIRSARPAIAVTMGATGRDSIRQVQVAEWSRSGRATRGGLCRHIERVPRQLFGCGTSMRGGPSITLRRCSSQPAFRAARRVIDVSGDGSNNRGRPVITLSRARWRPPARHHGPAAILALEPDLDRDLFTSSVIRGLAPSWSPRRTTRPSAYSIR